MSQSIQLRIQVKGDNQAEITANTLTLWRKFLGDPEAVLPWGVDYTVFETDAERGPSMADAETPREGRPQFTADVIINAAGLQD